MQLKMVTAAMWMQVHIQGSSYLTWKMKTLSTRISCLVGSMANETPLHKSDTLSHACAFSGVF
jgi:hypothetical protein